MQGLGHAAHPPSPNFLSGGGCLSDGLLHPSFLDLPERRLPLELRFVLDLRRQGRSDLFSHIEKVLPVLSLCWLALGITPACSHLPTAWKPSVNCLGNFQPGYQTMMRTTAVKAIVTFFATPAISGRCFGCLSLSIDCCLG